MSNTNYDIWASRIDDAIRAHERATKRAPVNRETLLARELLLAFAAEASAVVGAISRNIHAVSIAGNDRAAAMESSLDALMPHRQFSLLEYRYTLATGRQPGIRFHVDLDVNPPHVEVQLFEDLRRWRTDPSSRYVFEVPIIFELADSAFTPVPQPEASWAFTACTDWQSAVRETLALPFRHLYDSGLSAS